MSNQHTNMEEPKMTQTIQQLQEEVKTLQEQMENYRSHIEVLRSNLEVMRSNHEFEMRSWQFTAEQDQTLLDSRAEQVKQLEEEVEALTSGDGSIVWFSSVSNLS